LAQRIKNEKISAKDHVVQEGFFSCLLTKFLDFERNLINQRKNIPFGGSCLIAARKE
jgi:hypothetical protein